MTARLLQRWCMLNLLLLLPLAASAQGPAAGALWPNLAGNIERPLRYQPDHGDFLIENGAEFFNRPLFGRTTAFRVDAGDQPEFALYLPGRGGVLRLGLRTAAGAKWLHEARRVTARYRPGEMLYEVSDPLLGAAGVLRVAACALVQTDGLVVRAEATGVPAGVELVWAYGGVNGERGRRDGDIGTENVPISEWFQLRPDHCRGNAFTLAGASFTLHSVPATMVGLMPVGASLALADAAAWGSCARLLDSSGAGSPTPVVTGRMALANGSAQFLALQCTEVASAQGEELATYREVAAPRPSGERRPAPPALTPAYRPDQLPGIFAACETHFAAVRAQVAVATPDPFIDAAVGALNVAADAVWDEPQRALMHGAIAWRTPLLGWRGSYLLDDLGWPDRARAHFTAWATRQNTDPIPEKIPPPDEATHLARSEAALHSNGDLSHSHYDMNLVYIDALFRHLRWTGDLDLARQVWPVIERHLAWERRLFRREFGPEKLPLYEAYAAIWASDDLGYHGGGTAHASAYNCFHHREAARLARLLGHDPAPYEREAALIAEGMNRYLWLDGQGGFAEFKDLLGGQRVHPSAALWSFYHVIDSAAATPVQAARMVDRLARQMPRLPVRGPGVPTDRDYYVLPTSTWMPYTWSLNNVVLAENLHTALGCWQARRPTEAFTLLKSSLLASMFMGIAPGNVGTMNYLDVYRRESQRDFADGSGVLSRALVEGLFGVRPDALAGELLVAPGLPSQWEHARLVHPSVTFNFARHGDEDRYDVESRFARPMALRLQVAAPRDRVAEVTVNGTKAAWHPLADAVGAAVIEIAAPPAAGWAVTIHWSGERLAAANELFTEGPNPTPARVSPPAGTPVARVDQGEMSWLEVVAPVAVEPDEFRDPRPMKFQYAPADLAAAFNDRVTEIFRPGKYRSPRSPFVSLALPAQGLGAWAGHVNAAAEIDDRGLRAAAAAHGGRLVLPNGVPFATPGPGDAPNILFVSQWDNYPREATVPLAGKAGRVFLLMAGSTNPMQSRLDNGEVIVTYADGSTSRLTLRNPETWWPIEQDYLVDDYQFRINRPLPTRVDLQTGAVRVLDAATFQGQGRAVPGGAATVLELALDPTRELRSLTVRALANEVVIGLMAATLAR